MKNNDGGKNVSLASLGYSLANWTYSAATDEASYFKWMQECLWFGSDHAF